MGNAVEFDYYYGIEAEQFSFYRVPRLLIKDERFKGLMLDRMALSMKNGWLDDENRTYIIYAVDNIMEDLGCSKPTCIKIMRELDTDKGIGLIEKKRRGLGKPDIIYVKNFASAHEIARYADGWYSCFPYPELFEIYDKTELRLNYLSILHTEMFARVLDKEYVGDWHRLIGNILCFLRICDVEIEWKRLYGIFKQFLEVSLIYIC